jgi:hypothetical protein
MIKSIYKFLNPKFQKVFLEYKVDNSPRYGHGKPAHPELLHIIEKQEEQYGLAMYLLANPEKYQTLVANYYISEKPELASIIDDFWKHQNTKNVEKHGGSFWLKIQQ